MASLHKPILLFLAFVIFAMVSAPYILLGQEPPPLQQIQAGQLNRLEFNQQRSEYFEDELSLPGKVIEAKEPLPKKELVRIQTCSRGEGAWRVIFHFPKKMAYEQEQDTCGGLLLKFNQRFESEDLEKTQELLSYIARIITEGYSTFYLTPEREVTYCISTDDNQLILDIFPQYECRSRGSRYLKLARARLLVEQYHYYQAFQAIGELLTEYPGDKDSLVLLGSLEGQLPRWQKAMEIYYDLRQHYPCDVNLRQLSEEEYFLHSPFIGYTREIQQTPFFSVYQINRFQGEWKRRWSPCDLLYVGGIFDVTRSHMSSVVQNDGEEAGFLGNRVAGTVYARTENVWGSTYEGRFYVGEGGVYGLGVEGFWLWPGLQGTLTVSLDYNKPYWELFETFQFFGRSDTAQFEITSVYDRFIDWNVGGGGQRLGISGVPTALAALFATADFNYHLRVGNPIFTLNYGYDAYYVQYEKEKIDPDGDRFVRVPLNSYEFHFFRAYLEFEYCRYWIFTGFGGWSCNRLGANDWTAGLSLIYRKYCPNPWQVELSALRFPSTNFVGQHTNFLTLSVQIRF